MTALVYIVQPTKADPPLLCVMDDRSGAFHTFDISMLTISRLNAECSSIMYTAMGGTDHGRSAQEVAALWSKANASNEANGLVK